MGPERDPADDLFSEMWSLKEKLSRDRQFFLEGPQTPLTRNGFEVPGKLLSDPECENLCEFADSLIKENSYHISETAYVLMRSEIDMTTHQVYDKKTYQIFNVQDIDPTTKMLFRSGVIEKLFAERISVPLKLQTLSIQLNEPDPVGRQPFHVDSYSPPTYKAFIYLNDVTKEENGPYCMVPGSHLHVERKMSARAKNIARDLYYAQMEAEYDYDREGVPILGEKGTCILSVQSAVHAGHPRHTDQRRYMLVCYLTSDQNWRGPWLHSHGRVKSLRDSLAKIKNSTESSDQVAER